MRNKSNPLSSYLPRLSGFLSATQPHPSHLQRRCPNGFCGHCGSTHTGRCRSYRPDVFLILLPAPLTRKLFTFVITLNTIALVLAASGHFPYAIKWTSAMALGNLNFAVLMRNELFGRFLYSFVNTCFAKVAISIFYPISWNGCSLFISGHHCGGDLAVRLFFRYFNTLSVVGMNLTMASQHLGGIHSGCAMSGTAWLALKVVNNFRHHSINPDVILVIGTLTNIALIIGASSAFPWVRNTHHK